MANINELLARAAALRDETQLNSISPERAGGIMYETLLALNELWLQQGAALVISKIYASVAAMEADTSPVSDLTGKPIRPGMVVVIASSDSDNGSVYRYNGTSSPRWSLVGEIGNLEPVDSLDSDSTSLPLAAHQGKVLDGKISQLGQCVNIVNVNYLNNVLTTAYIDAASARSAVPAVWRKHGQIISYLLSDGWKTEIFNGVNSANWELPDTYGMWKPVKIEEFNEVNAEGVITTRIRKGSKTNPDNNTTVCSLYIIPTRGASTISFYTDKPTPANCEWRWQFRLFSASSGITYGATVARTINFSVNNSANILSGENGICVELVCYDKINETNIQLSPSDFAGYYVYGVDDLGYLHIINNSIERIDIEIHNIKEKIKGNKEDIEQFKEIVGVEDDETELPSSDTISSAYFGNGTSILSGNYGSIKVYPVNANDKIRLKQSQDYASFGEVRLGYIAAIFTIEVPEIGTNGSSVLVASVDAQILDWIAPSNGYLCCWERNDERTCFAYSVEEKWRYQEVLDELDPEVLATIVEKVYPLKGKTVAILGDSIMQNMCTPSIPTNVTTFKDIIEVDPTEYTVDDITIIDGYIYLTSSLNNGQVTNNSIRLRPVNSGQDAIDRKRWYGLETKLQVGDMFVLGMGGGRIVEDTNKIITAYPARHTSGILDGLMEDLPNQVRQLLRVVNDGIHNAPDCVVIWMGVNGADTIITDTYEEAMAIDWDILKDDQLGYIYRTKFYGAMRFAIESIYRAFPFATIFIISPAQNSRGDEKIDGSGPAYRGYTSLGNVAVAMKKISDRYACVFVDALHEMGLANFSYRADTILNGNYISTGTHLGNLVPTFLNSVEVDGLHPNSTGKILWENYLTTQLKARYYPKKDF